MGPRLGDHKIVMLVLNRNKAEIVLARHSVDGQAPVSAALRYCLANGVMGVGLRPIAGRPVTAKQAVNQDPRPASCVAAYHPAAGMRARRRHGSLRGEPIEPTILWSKDNSLQATVTANELHPRCHKWFVVLTRGRIHEVNRCHVALAAFDGSKPFGTANAHGLYRETLRFQSLDDELETNTMAADDYEVGTAVALATIHGRGQRVRAITLDETPRGVIEMHTRAGAPPSSPVVNDFEAR